MDGLDLPGWMDELMNFIYLNEWLNGIDLPGWIDQLMNFIYLNEWMD